MTPHTPRKELADPLPFGTGWWLGPFVTREEVVRLKPLIAAAPEMLASWQDTSIDEVVELLEAVKQQTDEGSRRVAKGVYENIHRALTSARHVQATRAALLARIEGKESP